MRLIPHSACTERIQVARGAYSSVVSTGQIVKLFTCPANYFLWGPARGTEKCHPCLVCTLLHWFFLCVKIRVPVWSVLFVKS